MVLKFFFLFLIPFNIFSKGLELHSGTTKKESFIDIPILWENEQGDKFSLSRFKGKYLMVSMTYTTCRMTCPLTVKKMKSLEEQFHKDKKEVEFILFTFDPENDTAKKLKRHYRHDFNITSHHWHFLRGGLEETKLIAKFLNIRFENIDEHIRHDNKFVLIGPNGEIIKTIEGWDSDDEQFLF